MEILYQISRQHTVDELDDLVFRDGLRLGDPLFHHADDAGREKTRRISVLHASERTHFQMALLEHRDHLAPEAFHARAAHELAGEDPLFAEEVQQTLETLDGKLDALEVESWFSGRFDDGDCILTVSPGQGGLEAQDWTEMLYNMYSRYADSKGWKVKVLDLVPGAEAVGLNKATLQIEGRLAYGMLRSENGVHRLVRISPTDVKQRRHTTFAAVEVLPVLPDDIEVNLDMNDVRVDVYRSSGPGGQCVNTTDSAVRLTHMPTGIVVTCQNEKSQLQNKDAAIRVLKSKLYEIEQQKRRDQIDELRGERMENSFGSQIRNYVLFPYQLVKDVRSGVETGNVVAVLDGDIDQFVVGYHKWRVSQE